MCKNCPFQEVGAIELAPGRVEEIKSYLVSGTNHECHGDRTGHTICRGGRNYQLEMWCRMGIIPEATDAALREAMKQAGVEPKGHV